MRDVWILDADGNGWALPVVRVDIDRVHVTRFRVPFSRAELEATGEAACPGVYGGRVFTFERMENEKAKRPADVHEAV